MAKSRALKETLNSLPQMGVNPFEPLQPSTMAGVAKQVHQDAKQNLSSAQESMMRAKVHMAGAKVMMKQSPGNKKSFPNVPKNQNFANDLGYFTKAKNSRGK